MGFELRGVDTSAGAGMIYRIMQVQHFVEHHVVERKAGSAGVIEDPADHDHVV